MEIAGNVIVVQNVTMDDIEKMITRVIDERLSRFREHSPKTPTERWMNIHELCDYLPNHPSVQTVYKWTSSRYIPYHKNGKGISFRQSEIDKWLSRGRRKSHDEIQEEAEEYVRRRPTKGIWKP